MWFVRATGGGRDQGNKGSRELGDKAISGKEEMAGWSSGQESGVQSVEHEARSLKH